VVDVSLLNAAIWQLGPDIVGAGVTGQDIPKFNLEEMPNPAASIYKTKDDRFIAFVLLQSDRFWADFCTRLDRADLITDERYANAGVRFQNRADCIIELRKTFGSKDLSHWEKAFAGFEGVWDVMRTAHEVHSDPQAIENGYLPKATNTSDIEFALAASPVQFDETPLELDRAPEHGEHTDALLAELGFSEDEIIQFKIDSVVL
jgi:crotonobetainyl-CoA:carnitine CoA-transferase CaiB-like acyl-CoA transferase